MMAARSWLILANMKAEAKSLKMEQQMLSRQKELSDRLFTGMGRIADRYAVCDLVRDRYEYHENMLSKPLYPETGRYRDFVELMSRRYLVLGKAEGMKMDQILEPEYLRRVLRKETDILKFEYCIREKNVYALLNIIPVMFDGDGLLTQVMMIGQDVGQKVELENLANTDGLTGLYNERYFSRVLANLEKKIKSELAKMLKDEREAYETFWKNFGRQLKYGVVSEYGIHKDLLQDLLLFWSSTEKKLVTLDEYVSRMKEDQKVIYYAAGDTVDKIDKLPQLEALKDQGVEILYFTEEVDEFVAQTLRSYKDKEFRSAMDGAADESAQEKAKEEADTHKDVFAFVKEALGDAVAEVKPSTRLKSHPVCLTAGEGLSFEMEKYFQLMQPDSSIKAQRILELNTEHPAFTALENAVTADPEKAKIYAKLLYDQALLIAGLPLDDPSGYTDLVCGLMK